MIWSRTSFLFFHHAFPVPHAFQGKDKSSARPAGFRHRKSLSIRTKHRFSPVRAHFQSQCHNGNHNFERGACISGFQPAVFQSQFSKSRKQQKGTNEGENLIEKRNFNVIPKRPIPIRIFSYVCFRNSLPCNNRPLFTPFLLPIPINNDASCFSYELPFFLQ